MAQLNSNKIIGLFAASMLFATGLFAVLPPPANTADTFTSIFSVLKNPVAFSILIDELHITKVFPYLEKDFGERKVTLLAPIDAAFNAFGQMGALRGTPLAEDFLKFHILKGMWPRKKIRNNSSARTLSDKTLNLKEVGKILYSIETDNGIIHVVDKVLLSPDVKKKLKLTSAPIAGGYAAFASRNGYYK